VSEACECEDQKCPEGIPAWVMTFADLMSLLLAFFVLLFSFSEMDKNVYKEMAGSMKDAFGVQRDIKAKEPPKGINVIAREFSPGKPDPTPFNEVRQSTTDDYKLHPVFTDPAEKGQENQQEHRIKTDGKAIRIALDEEITDGLIELELMDKRIVLRIREKASFSSGSEKLIKPFKSIANKIGNVFSGFDGQIVVSGHTDNYPIRTNRFRSNWELSSSRAVSVIHALKNNKTLKDKNYQVAAYAETRPVDTNETYIGRAKNRRVEIIFDYTGLTEDEVPPGASIEGDSVPGTANDATASLQQGGGDGATATAGK
jgi:chemotaxis protein MotB